MDMKTCFKCGETLPIAEFYRHKQMKDGRLNKCKQCTKADVTNHRNANIERVREYDRARAMLPHRVELRSSYSREYAKLFPDRRRAHSAVNNAVRDGRLDKPGSCTECGNETVIHGHHHHGYTKEHWLDVQWLCAPCHKKAELAS